MKKLLLLLLLLSSVAHAGIVSKPYTFFNNTIADANQVNANYDTLYTLVNGNLDNDNIAAAAGIVFSKLDAATVAGVTASQNLTNKTLTGPVFSGSITGTYTLAGTPTITAPTITGTIAGSPTIPNPTITGTVSGTPSIPSATLADPTITGTVAGSATYSSPTITGPTITGTISGTPTITTPVIASLYQDAAKTKLMTVPAVASDTFALVNATQTLYNKTIDNPTFSGTYTLSSPIINGGTIDGATISSPIINGTPTAAAASWTNLGTVSTIDINGGTIDGATIGGSVSGAGSFTTLNANDTVTFAANKSIYLDGGTNDFIRGDGSAIKMWVDNKDTANPNFVLKPEYMQFIRYSNSATGNGALYLSHFRYGGAISQDGDYTGAIFGIFKDSSGNLAGSGRIVFRVDDVTSGTTDGSILFMNAVNGSNYTTQATLNSTALTLGVPLLLPDVDPPVANHANRNGIVKGWAEIATDGSITASYNVSSVNHAATGVYTVYWTTDFASAAYAVVASANSTDEYLVTASSISVGFARITTRYAGENASSFNVGFHVIAIGDQ